MTGKKIENIDAIFGLYYLLAAEESQKLKLPSWTHGYYPKGLMRDATFLYYETMSSTDLLKKFSGGKSMLTVIVIKSVCEILI